MFFIAPSFRRSFQSIPWYTNEVKIAWFPINGEEKRCWLPVIFSTVFGVGVDGANRFACTFRGSDCNDTNCRCIQHSKRVQGVAFICFTVKMYTGVIIDVTTACNFCCFFPLSPSLLYLWTCKKQIENNALTIKSNSTQHLTQMWIKSLSAKRADKQTKQWTSM